MRQRKRGFTVTELVIFIVVIAILAGSMITGFVVLSNEMKAAEREREANQAALQAKLDEISAKLNRHGRRTQLGGF